jgi:hypothetical protein
MGEILPVILRLGSQLTSVEREVMHRMPGRSIVPGVLARLGDVNDEAERELAMWFAACGGSWAKPTSRVEFLLETCDEERLGVLLERIRLVEHVGGRIVAAAGRERFPRLALAAWGSTAALRTLGAIQAVVQYGALERLSRAGIRAAPIKGADLALRVYGDLGLRGSADVDIVVEPDRLDDAVDVLGTLGYDGGPDASSPWLMALHRRLEHPRAAMPPVEVHWRTEWYSESAMSGGLARAALERAIEDPHGRGLRFRLADELALLLLVFARDGLPGLRLPADVAAWWDRYGPDLGPLPLQGIVEEDPSLAVPLATAAVVCERLVGLPAARLLDIAPARSRRGRLAARLSSAFLDEPRKRSAVGLIDGLLGGRQAWSGFARRRLLLPVGHVATTYRLTGTPAGARVRMLQAQHPVRQLVYYAWYIASPPPRAPEIDWAPV